MFLLRLDPPGEKVHNGIFEFCPQQDVGIELSDLKPASTILDLKVSEAHGEGWDMLVATPRSHDIAIISFFRYRRYQAYCKMFFTVHYSSLRTIILQHIEINFLSVS